MLNAIITLHDLKYILTLDITAFINNNAVKTNIKLPLYF